MHNRPRFLYLYSYSSILLTPWPTINGHIWCIFALILSLENEETLTDVYCGCKFSLQYSSRLCESIPATNRPNIWFHIAIEAEVQRDLDSVNHQLQFLTQAVRCTEENRGSPYGGSSGLVVNHLPQYHLGSGFLCGPWRT